MLELVEKPGHLVNGVNCNNSTELCDFCAKYKATRELGRTKEDNFICIECIEKETNQERTEKELNGQALNFTSGLFEIVGNLTAPLFNQIKRNKEEILDLPISKEYKEELTLKMTVSEIKEYVEHYGPILQGIIKNAGSWEHEVAEIKKQLNN